MPFRSSIFWYDAAFVITHYCHLLHADRSFILSLGVDNWLQSVSASYRITSFCNWIPWWNYAKTQQSIFQSPYYWLAYCLTNNYFEALNFHSDTHTLIRSSSFHEQNLLLVLTLAIGNLYHHYLLANLRKPGEKSYKVPRGGLFEYIAALYYLFEIITWIGIAIVSQHLVNVFAVFAMLMYLAQRSKAQTEWNRTKLKDKYPVDRKHLITFIF